MLTLYKKNGFTLLEMIIVIAIAGILSAALAYTVPFISRINDTVSSRYQAQIMANVIMTRIESELRYADAVDVKTSLPETLQQGNKYIYFIGGILYEKTYGSSPLNLITGGGFEEYTCQISFEPVNTKVINVSLDIFKDGDKIYYGNKRISILNLGSEDITGVSSGMCVSYKVSAREPVSVSDIFVTSLEDFINTSGGILQMNAVVLPLNAANRGVVWSVNETDNASISQEGLLMPLKNGLLTVKATAIDGSGVTGMKQILVSNQSIVITSLTLTTSTGSTNLRYGGRTLTIIPHILPNDATNQTITWSVSNTAYATINSSGVLTSGNKKNKSVIVTASTNDGSGITATIQIRIVP